MSIYPGYYMSTGKLTEDYLSSISERLASIEQIMKESAMQARPFQGRNPHAHKEVFSIDADGIHIPPQLRVQLTTKKNRELENLRAQVLRLNRELSVKNNTINQKDHTIITLQKQIADQERLLDAYAQTSDWD
ncbi:MAG: hypothetical protein F4X63_09210 [Nitrospira sp. SB0662_bin_26]|nr:hypothetical protein [Nitrospira sp. SB0662_bin_26]